MPLAFVFERNEFPGRSLLGTLVALPVALPPLIGVIAFLFLYGESGFASRGVQALLRLSGAAVAALGPGRDPPRPRLLDVRLLLHVHAGRARAARRLAPRGRREPGRGARARGADA